MKNTIFKSLILAIAIAIAIGSVLFFVRYVVSPPEEISAEATAKDIFNPNLKDVVSAYNPDSLSLKDAEIKFDALIDRANIFIDDKLCWCRQALAYDDWFFNIELYISNTIVEYGHN